MPYQNVLKSKRLVDNGHNPDEKRGAARKAVTAGVGENRKLR